MAIQYFTVYQRGASGTLDPIKLLEADDMAQALDLWSQTYGDNYGKVVILPEHTRRFHVGFRECQVHD